MELGEGFWLNQPTGFLLETGLGDQITWGVVGDEDFSQIKG